MKKLFAAIARAPKRAASLAIIAAAVIVPAALFAWGPDRPTFTKANPAPYVTFNSITDATPHGDERNFVQIKEADADNSTYGENVTLQPGKEYQVYVYYHNNAASNLNDAAHDYKGVAKDAFMRVQMPATVKAGEKARITGFVGASNANPGQVWDEAYGTSASNVSLRYIADSAVIHSKGAVNGKKLPNNLYTTGTPLGYDALNGTLPGCNDFAGYVTFKFTVDKPNFEIQKQVSKAGENKYSEEVKALPGDEVEYKIQYKNTGTTQQNNVVIKDKLPAGVTYVNNSTFLSNGLTGSKWVAVSDNTITARGINIGSYAANGGNAYVKFKAKVVDNDKLEKCGVNTLVNTATAETQNGSKSDTANVVVSKTCEEKPEECKPGIPVGDERCQEKPEECKPGIPAGDERCEEKPEECKPGVPAGDEKCEETPTTPETPQTPTETPKELPKTGAGDDLLALIGASSLIAAIGYYVASRRAIG